MIALVIALACVVAGVVTWALWPDPPRQREYVDATACLLTDEKGIVGTAEPVWSAMRETSVTSLVRVQYLQVNGPQTAANASAYLASLSAGRCGAVIAVGQAQVDAVTAAAGSHPEVRFATVGGGTPAANVQVIDTAAPDALRTAVKELVDALADGAP